MNIGFPGEGFPYTNFHDMNLDWMIKIAKDFLDQYTHIQEIIEQGKTDLINLTDEGLASLQEKYETLEGLLDAWYNEHSEDIAEQLADALEDLSEELADALSDINDKLAEAISDFNTRAGEIAATTIASIPADYSSFYSNAYKTNPITSTDLNDYTEPGSVILASATTYAHSPTGITTGQKSLYVIAQNGGTYRLQFLIAKGYTTESEIYCRIKSGSPGTWGDWFLYYTTVFNPNAYVARTADYTDLDSYLNPGTVILASDVEYTHVPDGVGLGQKMLIVVPYPSGSFRVQFLITDGYGSLSKIYSRVKSGSPASWGSWFLYYSATSNEGTYNAISPTYTDLDDYINPGTVVLLSNVEYDHVPDDVGLGQKMLIVISYPSGTFRVQFLITDGYGGESKIYSRIKSGSPASWGNWFLYFAEDYQQLPTRNDNFTPISNVSLGANSGTNITVMSYNVSHYNNDTEVYLPNDKALNLIKLLAMGNPDIIGLQEDDQYIDSADSKLTRNYIYYPQYPYRIGEGSVTIFSKTGYSTGKLLNYSNGRALRYGVFTISDKTVLVISTHLVADQDNTGTTSAESIAARLTQMTELFQWIDGDIDLLIDNTSNYQHVPTHTHVVICMDGNTLTNDDKENITTIAHSYNYSMANGERMGWFNTCKYNGSWVSLDNIIVSSNVIINSTEALSNLFHFLYSDHVPVISKLTLK